MRRRDAPRGHHPKCDYWKGRYCNCYVSKNHRLKLIDPRVLRQKSAQRQQLFHPHNREL